MNNESTSRYGDLLDDTLTEIREFRDANPESEIPESLGEQYLYVLESFLCNEPHDFFTWLDEVRSA